MKKLKFHIFYLFAILPFFASAAIVQHDNILCAKSGTQNVEVTVEKFYSYFVTNGQPFDVNVENIKTGSNAGCVNIRAGRKASVETVNWVKRELIAELEDDRAWTWQNAGISNPLQQANYSLPDQLNSALMVKLKFKFNYGTSYICDKVIIGQGHNSGGNIWWMFTNTNNIKQPKNFNYYRLLSCVSIDKYGDENDPPLGILQGYIPGRNQDKFSNSKFQVLPQEKL